MFDKNNFDAPGINIVRPREPVKAKVLKLVVA